MDLTRCDGTKKAAVNHLQFVVRDNNAARGGGWEGGNGFVWPCLSLKHGQQKPGQRQVPPGFLDFF